MRLLKIATFISALIVISCEAMAAGVIVGPLCIDGAKGVRFENGKTITLEGSWTPVSFSYQRKPGAGIARVIIFDKPIPPSDALLSCTEIAVGHVQNGARLLLSGRANRLFLDGSVFESNAGQNAFQINPGKLDVELGLIDSGALTVMGGTSDLRGAKLWIRNPNMVLATSRKMTGELEIEAWNRTIADARIAIGGTEALKATLLTENPGAQNVIFRLDTQTGEARLWQGSFRTAAQIPISAKDLTLAGIALSGVEAKGDVRLTAVRGQLSLSLGTVAGKAGKAVVAKQLGVFTYDQPQYTLERAQSEAIQSVAQLSAGAFTITGAYVSSPMMAIADQSNNVVMRGKNTTQIATISAEAFDAGLSFDRPDGDTLKNVLPDGAMTSLTFALKSEGDGISLKGTSLLNQIAIGKAAIRNELKAVFESRFSGNDLRIPVKFDLHDLSGSFTVGDEDQAGVFTATLLRFLLDGVFILPLDNLKESRLEVLANHFELGLRGAAFLKPVIAGTKPSIGQSDLVITNTSTLVAGQKSSGILSAKLDVLILGEPIFRIGEKGSKARASLTLSAQGGGEIEFNAGTGKFGVARASFAADNVEFKFLDADAVIDLGGILVADPKIKFASLRIAISKAGGIEIGRGSLDAFEASASSLTRPADPARPAELSFSANLAQPVRIVRIDAGYVELSDEVALELLYIKGVSFALNNASADFGKDFGIRNATFNLVADGLKHTELNGKGRDTLEGARLAADGRLDANLNNNPRFTLGLAMRGPTDALDGSGQAEISGFSGNQQSNIDFGFKCAGGNRLQVPIEYNFAVANVSLSLTVQGGHYAARGEIGPLALAIHSKSGRECHGETRKEVIIPEQSGWTYGVCVDGWKVHKCKWKWSTPEVNFKYRWNLAIREAAAGLVLTHPVLSLSEDRLKVCNIGLLRIVSPIIVGGYTPEIVSNAPGADAIFNTIVKLGLEPVQSVLASSILQSVGNLFEHIMDLGQDKLCLKLGV
ncbi:hypothetical protein BH10PSE7_BH10PSE7_22970 [soil metagenome]